jgi:hypothetical protein
MESIARRRFISFSVISAGALAAPRARAQGGVWVVTSQEAAMPPAATSKAGRSITRGPAIRQISPASPVAPNQPFDLKVEFAGRGGEKIDPKTAQIVILRGNSINVTQRLQPFITANGIEVPAALVPPGMHVLQVAVSDGGGRQSIANIEIDAH